MLPSSPSRVSGGDAAPDHVSEAWRDVIECLRANQWFMCGRQQRRQGTEARPENADAVVALRVQPGDCASRIEHRLPADLQRSCDVRRDDVVGTVEFGRHTPIVVGQTQTKRREAAHRQQLRESDMPACIRVPLRQHDDSGAMTPARFSWDETTGRTRVVLGVRRGDRAWKVSNCSPSASAPSE